MKTGKAQRNINVLAGDIGGTNTNLALLERKGVGFALLKKASYSTKGEPSLLDPMRKFLVECGNDSLPDPSVCCISGAGPVRGRKIILTNAPWGIDGDEVEGRFGFPTHVINDFAAVSYGMLLLDPANPKELLPLPRPDGSMAKPDKTGTKVIAGAGTGLGFGYIVHSAGMPVVCPSEGGHVTIPAYDDETRAFARWLDAKFGFAAGAEAAVSGMGIGNIFRYLSETAKDLGPDATAVLAAGEHDRPAMISRAADRDALCGRTMDIFVRLYARICADAAATFLPTGGIYLAGGIAAKNERRFTEGSRFMSAFGMAYREHIRAILAETPVYIVKDYAISLYGAANAACILSSL